MGRRPGREAAGILNLCRRVILGQARRELGYEGSAFPRTGPDADSPNAKFIDLRFWKQRFVLEIPLELTQIVCLDPPIIRTAAGVVHATPSDADVIESKIIAVLARPFLQHRDLVDVFLYADNLLPESPARLQEKLRTLQLPPEMITRRIKDLSANREYHARATQKIIDEQIEPTIGEQMNAGGGGKTVFDSALRVLMLRLNER